MVAADHGVTGNTREPQNGLPGEMPAPVIGAVLLPVPPATFKVADTAQVSESVCDRPTLGPVNVAVPPVMVAVGLKLNS